MPGPQATPEDVRMALAVAETIHEAERDRLRDEFAMAALTGIYADPVDHERSINEDAELAYVVADAMMRAREK